MKQVFRFFVQKPLLANLLTLMILLLGLYSASRLQRDTFPEVDMGEMMISTHFLGASSADVELMVTNKIEEQLKGVDGIAEYHSYSIDEYSTIRIKLDLDTTDQEGIKQDVRDAVDRVIDFPVGVDRPLVLDIDSKVWPLVELGIVGDLPYDELRLIAKSFKKKLETLDGVSRLEPSGYYDQQVHINVYSDRLEQFKISFQELNSAIRTTNQRQSLGQIETEPIGKPLFIDSQFDPLESVEDVVVRSNFDGKNVRVKDLATVQVGYEDPEVMYHLNGQNAISFFVYKSSTVDVLDLMNRVDQLILETEQYLPEGVRIVKTHDFTKYLKNRFSVLVSNGVMGLILVVIVLGIFMNTRTAFWVSMGIPVAVMGVVFMLDLTGQTLNLISMMALILVVGIIVDDGIIVSESILSLREEGASIEEATVEGINRVYKPVITTVLTTILAFLPMFFMSGIMGRFIYAIPLVVSVALLTSLIEVIVALPPHMKGALMRVSSHEEGWRGRIIRPMKATYGRLLYPCLKYSGISALTLILVMVLVGVLTARFMSFELFPESAADQFLIEVELEKGTNVEDTLLSLKPIEELLLRLDSTELDSFTVRAGQMGDGANEPIQNHENMAVIHVDLQPSGLRKRTAREIVEDTLRGQTDQLTHYKSVKYVLDQGGPPTGKPITIRLAGGTKERRELLAQQVMGFLAKQAGVKDLERDDEKHENRLQIMVDDDKMAQLGLETSQLISTIQTAYAGREITDIRKDDEDVGFWVQLTDKDRSNIDNLMNLSIPNAMGRLIQVSQVATIKEVPGNPTFIHFKGDRVITVTGDVNKEEANILTVLSTLQKQFGFEENWSDIQVLFGGEGEETQKSVQDLLKTFLLAIFGIFCLLMILFNSVIQPFLVLLAIPFGLIGVSLAFMMHQEPMGFLSMIGTIGLCGVVVNDALVMVSHINYLREQKPDLPLIDVVKEGSVDRFRSVILTSITTIIGVLPLAYGIGGSDPFIAPLALALGYGLVFSTPLTLFFLPSYYVLMTRMYNKCSGWRRK